MTILRHHGTLITMERTQAVNQQIEMLFAQRNAVCPATCAIM
jgi:hypothetical protein